MDRGMNIYPWKCGSIANQALFSVVCFPDNWFTKSAANDYRGKKASEETVKILEAGASLDSPSGAKENEERGERSLERP